MESRINEAIAPLSPVSLNQVCQPKTVEEGRANLKRYYGCIGDELIVLVPTRQRRGVGKKIKRWDGQRQGDKWLPSFNRKTGYNRNEPHKAITSASTSKDYCYVKVDINYLNNLSDLYQITESGMLYGSADPVFTMNLVIGGESPFLEDDDDYLSKLVCFTREYKERYPHLYSDEAWLSDRSAYRLLSNEDTGLTRFRNFHFHMDSKGLGNRWRQMNEYHTRYLHWLLLGPFAPYQYGESTGEVAA
jgi:hypothetical protein